MGLLNRFKKMIVDNNHSPKPISNSSIFKDDLNCDTDIDGWIIIKKLGFSGQYHRSNNEKFIIACSDGSFLDKRNGRVLLLKEEKLRFTEHFERPKNGAVSDDGTFIFNDWTFNRRHGIFYAFDENGTLLLKKDFNLNLINNGISNNGQYAVCQAANSDHEDDGGKLFFFDLNEKKILWKKHMETGGANWYKFDTEKEILYLIYNGGCEYRYTFEGEFIDQEKRLNDMLMSDIGYEFLDAIKEIREQIENGNISYTYNDVIIMLSKGSKRFKDPDTRARIHRNIGEIYHAEGLTTDSIFHLERAYELNPKVGVKRLLGQLKK